MKLIAQYDCRCGEGPLYDNQRNVVFWTDIDTGRLFQIDCITHEHRQIYQGDPVGGFTLQTNGDLILFRVTDIVVFNPETGTLRKLLDFADDGVPRFNDTSAGPNGDCYAGTMGRTKTSGGLFRLRKDRKLDLLFRGTDCSNGMAWSPDHNTLYYTNTTTSTITAYDFDLNSGDLSHPRTLITANPAQEGHPDGLTIDSQGNLYSMRWAGNAIYTYFPNGSLRSKIDLPVPNVTSACFGGRDMTDLYITTAQRGDPTNSGGGLYLYHNNTPGLPDFRSNIRID